MEGAAGFVTCKSNDQDDCFKHRSSAYCHKVDGAVSEEPSTDRCFRSCKSPILFNDSSVGAYWRRKEADEVLHKLITDIRGKRLDCVKFENETVEQMENLDSQLSCYADSSFHETTRTSWVSEISSSCLDNCGTGAPLVSSVKRNENVCRNELALLPSGGVLPCHEQETHNALHTGIVKEEKNEYLLAELDTSQDLATSVGLSQIPHNQHYYHSLPKHFIKEEVDIKDDIYDECLEQQVNAQMMNNDIIRKFNIPELISNKKDGGTRIKTEPNTDIDTIQNDFMECQQVDSNNLTTSCTRSTNGTSSRYCEYDISNTDASSVVFMESLSVPALSRLSEKTNTVLLESHTEETCDEQNIEDDEHCTCKGLMKQREHLDYEEKILLEQRDCIRIQISNMPNSSSGDVVRRTKLLEENVMLKAQIEEKICNIRNRIKKLNEILCFEGNLNIAMHCLKCKTLKHPGEPKFGSLFPCKKPALKASFCGPDETKGHTQMYGSATSINSNVEEESEGMQNSSLMVHSSLENCSLQYKHKRKTDEDDSIKDISQRKESKKSRKGRVDTRRESRVDGELLQNGAHLNWCKLCNVFVHSVIDYVHHLGSSEHSQRRKVYDKSWLRKLPQTEKRHFLQEDYHESYGVEFLDSATAFFCKLCEVLIWDEEDVMLHPRSPLHVQNFKDFVSENFLSASGFRQRKMSAYMKYCEDREAENNGKQTESEEISEYCPVSASHTFTDAVKSPCQKNVCKPEIQVPSTTKINPTLCWIQNSESSTVVTSSNLSESNTVDIPVTLTDGNECNGSCESIKKMQFFPANKTDSSSGSTTKSTPIITSKLRSTEGESNKNSVFLRKPLTVKTTENITETLINKDDRFTQLRVAISDLEDLIEATKTVKSKTSQNDNINDLTHQTIVAEAEAVKEEGTFITTDSIGVNRRGRNFNARNDSLSISKSSKSKLKSKTFANDKLKSVKMVYNKIGSPVTLENSIKELITSPEISEPLLSALSALDFTEKIKRHIIFDDTSTQSGTGSKSSGTREKSSEIIPLQPNDIQVEQTMNATEISDLSPKNVKRVKSRDNLSKVPNYSVCVTDVAKEKLTNKDRHAFLKKNMIMNDSERKPKNSVRFEDQLDYNYEIFNNKEKNGIRSVGKTKSVKTNTIKRKNISLPKRKHEILRNVKSKLSYSVSCDISLNSRKTSSSSVETKKLVEPNTASNSVFSKCMNMNSLSIDTRALIKSDKTNAAKALKGNSAMDIHDALGNSSMAPQTTTSSINAEMISQFIKSQREKSVHFSDVAVTSKRAPGAPLGICKLDNTLAMRSQNQSSAVNNTKKLSKTCAAPDILTSNKIIGCHLSAANSLSINTGNESLSLSCNESKTALNHNASKAEKINTHGSATKSIISNSLSSHTTENSTAIKTRESISQPPTPIILASKSDPRLRESITSSSSTRSKISLSEYWKRKATCTRKIKETTSTSTSGAQNSSNNLFTKAVRISGQHTEHDLSCIRSGGDSSQQVVLPDANLMASRPDSEQVSQPTVNLLADQDSRKTHIAFASVARKAEGGQAFIRDLKNLAQKSGKQGTFISEPHPEVKIDKLVKTRFRGKSRKKLWETSRVLLVGDKRLENVAYKPPLKFATKIRCIPQLQLPEAFFIINEELDAANFDAVFLMVGHADITVQIQDEKCKAFGCSTPYEYLMVKPENFKPFLEMVSHVNSCLKSLFPKLYILWGSLYPVNMHDYLYKATVHQKHSDIHNCGSDICRYIFTNHKALKSLNDMYEEFSKKFTKFMEKYEIPHFDFSKCLHNKKGANSGFHTRLLDGIHMNDKLTEVSASRIKNIIAFGMLQMQKNSVSVDEIKT